MGKSLPPKNDAKSFYLIWYWAQNWLTHIHGIPTGCKCHDEYTKGEIGPDHRSLYSLVEQTGYTQMKRKQPSWVIWDEYQIPMQ